MRSVVYCEKVMFLKVNSTRFVEESRTEIEMSKYTNV